jgi:hypothetical protein
LQRPFSVAPFPKTRFADIELPFGSFVIVLEEPVQVQREDGSWGRFDALWVNSFGKKDRTTRCRLLRIPVAGTNAHRLPENAIRRCEIALRREGVSGFALEFNRQWKRWTAKVQEPPAEYAFPVFPTPVRDSDYVSDHIIPTNYRRVWDPTDRSSEEMDRVGQWTCSVAKIILGWCLYRKHMPSENYAWTEIPPQKRGARGQSTGVITDPAYICTILRIGTLDIGKYREQNLDDAGSNFFQWPHWRSGHWKRERGAGPRAQKTLWIDSYPVREDLMPLYGIHGGKLTNVEGELD